MVTSDSTLEGELRDREESHLRYERRSHGPSMAELLADEFVEFGASGRIFDRAAVIEATSRQAPFNFRIEAFSARALAGEVALTTYRLAAWSEPDREAKITLRSSLWVRRAGRWQMVFPSRYGHKRGRRMSEGEAVDPPAKRRWGLPP